MDDCRVLSIQSHVVRGYVGNKSATFPLQVLGFEVDAINSVQFSNHTGYDHVKGQVLNSDELKRLFEGLTSNNIHHYSHLLTGYVGSESFLHEVLNVVKELRRQNPKLVYVCDPVLGDNGKYYVPEALLPIYRDQLIPLADLITPNQFEAEALAEMKINSEADAFQAMEIFHKKGVKTVVLTSTELGDDKTLILLGSTRTERESSCVKIEFPKLNGTFTGTGDLFTSMLLAWTWRLPYNFKVACEKALSAIQLVLARTLSAAQESAGPGNQPSPSQIELRLIQSLDDIRNPADICKGKIVN